MRCGARCTIGGQQAMDDRGGKHAACRRGRDCRLGAGHGQERTKNIPYMFVTLEVSKLSGWLNADALCRESKEGHAVRGEVYGSGAAGGGRPRRQACSVQERARLPIGGRARGGEHVEHVARVCDAGGFPVRNIRVEVRQAIEEVAHVGDL